ncbi:hypothetical protein GCM10023323_10420 [Streptomyces thinghirensis]|uniref:Uncharacterized protein n=1 Tax=Streptomyces thinghirensis TaxID=551547 RepID=A0ABP9SZ87_9ACTN
MAGRSRAIVCWVVVRPWCESHLIGLVAQELAPLQVQSASIDSLAFADAVGADRGQEAEAAGQ